MLLKLEFFAGIIILSCAVELFVTGGYTRGYAPFLAVAGFYITSWGSSVASHTTYSGYTIKLSHSLEGFCAFALLDGIAAMCIGVSLCVHRLGMNMNFVSSQNRAIAACLFLIYLITGAGIGNIAERQFALTKDMTGWGNEVSYFASPAGLIATVVNIALAAEILLFGLPTISLVGYGASAGLIALGWACKEHQIGPEDANGAHSATVRWNDNALAVQAFTIIAGVIAMMAGAFFLKNAKVGEADAYRGGEKQVEASGPSSGQIQNDGVTG